MKQKIMAILLVLLVAYGTFRFSANALKPYHTVYVEINKPYSQVWQYLSQPQYFPQLYPQWVKKIALLAPHHLQIMPNHPGPLEAFDMQVDGAAGLIDFNPLPKAPQQVVCHSRVISLDDGQRTGVVHAFSRPNGMSGMVWFLMKQGIEADYATAKRVIESNAVKPLEPLQVTDPLVPKPPAQTH